MKGTKLAAARAAAASAPMPALLGHQGALGDPSGHECRNNRQTKGQEDVAW